MPLNPPDTATGSLRRPDSGRRLALVASGVAVSVLALAVWAQLRDPGPNEAAHRMRLDAVQTGSPSAGRESRGLEPPVGPDPTADRAPTTVAPTTAWPLGPATPPTAAPDPTRATPARTGSAPLGRGPSGQPAGDGSAGGPADGTAPGGGGTFWLPGSDVQAPITGPMADLPEDADDDLADTPVTQPEPAATPEPEEVDPPEPDELGCPNLGLLPIGGFDEDRSATFGPLYERFRALAPAEWDRDDLVCGHPLEPWRDLVVQRLEAGGRADGAIVTAADGSSIALRLTEAEWGSYRFRYGGAPTGTNLLGYPVARIDLDGVAVIRTTGGGLVFAQPGAVGVPVIGGLWDVWEAAGGPSGSMGLPLGIPESAAGPTGAITWESGLVSTGARQSFQHGWVFLPGVISDVDAAAQPADRYQWHLWSELPPEPEIDYRGHIVKLGPTTWYVDRAGIRHWIPSTSAWMCATWDLKATQHVVEAYELDAYPLGSDFVCADFKRPTDGDPPVLALAAPAH